MIKRLYPPSFKTFKDHEVIDKKKIVLIFKIFNLKIEMITFYNVHIFKKTETNLRRSPRHYATGDHNVAYGEMTMVDEARFCGRSLYITLERG